MFLTKYVGINKMFSLQHCPLTPLIERSTFSANVYQNQILRILPR